MALSFKIPSWSQSTFSEEQQMSHALYTEEAPQRSWEMGVIITSFYRRGKWFSPRQPTKFAELRFTPNYSHSEAHSYSSISHCHLAGAITLTAFHGSDSEQ